MRFFHNLFAYLAGLFRPQRNLPTVIVQPPRRAHRNQAQPMPPSTNPAMRILQALYSPRQSSEHRTNYRPVGNDGVVIHQREEWRRDNNAMRTIHETTLVVTCSGQVVKPNAIRSVCAHCGGHDASLFRCNHPQCGVSLCRLHARFFSGPRGQIALCDRHYRAAVSAVNTWQSPQRPIRAVRKNG